MNLKTSSAKRRSFCPGGDKVLPTDEASLVTRLSMHVVDRTYL